MTDRREYDTPGWQRAIRNHAVLSFALYPHQEIDPKDTERTVMELIGYVNSLATCYPQFRMYEPSGHETAVSVQVGSEIRAKVLEMHLEARDDAGQVVEEQLRRVVDAVKYCLKS